MKRKNIKLLSKLQAEMEAVDTALNAWEQSKMIDSSSNIQIRESPLNPKYYKVNLNDIPFGDLRKQMLLSLNEKRDNIDKEIDQLINEPEDVQCPECLCTCDPKELETFNGLCENCAEDE